MSEQTIEKLKKMKLSKFAEAYQDQKGKPEYQKMSFDDRLTLLVDLEYDSRVNHTIERNIVYDGWRDPLCSLYESHHQTAS